MLSYMTEPASIAGFVIYKRRVRICVKIKSGNVVKH